MSAAHPFGCACDECVLPAARKHERAWRKEHGPHGAPTDELLKGGTTRWRWVVCPCGVRLQALKQEGVVT